MSEQSHSISDLAKRLGITSKSLYNWRDRQDERAQAYQQKQSSNEESRRLKTELKRVTTERDILKESAVFFAGESKKNTRS